MKNSYDTIVHLEPLSPSHASALTRHAGHINIAASSRIPHLLPDDFISEQLWESENDTSIRHFSIFLHGSVAGMCSLSHISFHTHSCQLAYWVAVPFWGRGIATEAVGQIIHVAGSMGLGIIMSGVWEKNIASCRVLKKNNFEHTCSHVRSMAYGEKFANEIIHEFRLNL